MRSETHKAVKAGVRRTAHGSGYDDSPTMSSSTRVRCGIDTGGTFTDFVGVDESSGELIASKWPSSHDNPTEAIAGVVRESGLPPTSIYFLILGTTVATNALIQRNGAHVIYVTTKGFEDVLYIQRMNRRYHYSYEWTKPTPFVEMRDCIGVRERIDSGGEVVVPMDAESMDQVALKIAQGLEGHRPEDSAIAVSLLFSYLNPEHEIRLKDFLQARFPGIAVSVSHEVAPIWREYERGSTVVADAFVKPLLHRYVNSVRESLDNLGLRCPWAIMKSNGGHATARSAEGQPVNLILSGQSGGIIGGKYFGGLAGERNLITVDMGGTSCDVGVVREGKLSYITNYEIEWGLPVSAPFVDLTAIGAGGGSVAWIDKGGFLQVGPQSAGAVPGPLCYGKGGTRVTVTDANLALGRLNPDYFLGGKMGLDAARALEGLAELGSGLGLSPIEAAQAVIDMANENMANAIRVVSIERGLDPRDFAMVAFGGAGPLHAGGLVEKMGMRKMVIPIHPGLCSAFGAALADFQVDKVWSTNYRSDSLDADLIIQQFRDLEAAAGEELREEGFDEVPETLRSISMRYAGQNYEHDVELRSGSLTRERLEEALDEFHRLHKGLYGYSISGEVIELIRVNVTLVGRTRKPRMKAPAVDGDPGPLDSRPVYFDRLGFVSCPVFRRDRLAGGFSLEGPAVIEEIDSTILLHPNHSLRVNRHGVISIRA